MPSAIQGSVQGFKEEGRSFQVDMDAIPIVQQMGSKQQSEGNVEIALLFWTIQDKNCLGAKAQKPL
jgi:hypothetical protein